MNDGEQLFPVSTEDWIRKKGVTLQQVGLRTLLGQKVRDSTPARPELLLCFRIT